MRGRARGGEIRARRNCGIVAACLDRRSPRLRRGLCPDTSRGTTSGDPRRRCTWGNTQSSSCTLDRRGRPRGPRECRGHPHSGRTRRCMVLRSSPHQHPCRRRHLPPRLPRGSCHLRRRRSRAGNRRRRCSREVRPSPAIGQARWNVDAWLLLLLPIGHRSHGPMPRRTVQPAPVGPHLASPLSPPRRIVEALTVSVWCGVAFTDRREGSERRNHAGCCRNELGVPVRRCWRERCVRAATRPARGELARGASSSYLCRCFQNPHDLALGEGISREGKR
jgi:hypothetical protein